MTRHHCPGLYECEDHPRPAVVRRRHLPGWIVILPGGICPGVIYSTREAALDRAILRERRLLDFAIAV